MEGGGTKGTSDCWERVDLAVILVTVLGASWSRCDNGSACWERVDLAQGDSLTRLVRDGADGGVFLPKGTGLANT